jgi:hypothetical protein
MRYSHHRNSPYASQERSFLKTGFSLGSLEILSAASPGDDAPLGAVPHGQSVPLSGGRALLDLLQQLPPCLWGTISMSVACCAACLSFGSSCPSLASPLRLLGEFRRRLLCEDLPIYLERKNHGESVL